MRNQKFSDSDNLTKVAPAGGVTAGVPALIGNQVVVPVTDAAVGERFACKTRGVFEFPKVGATAFADGVTVEWDPGNGYVIADGAVSGAFDLGQVDGAAGASAATVRVALHAQPSAANP